MRNFFLLFFTFISFLESVAQSKELSNQISFQIEKDLKIITKGENPRNYKNTTTLNLTASYINQEFKKVCDSVAFQKYNVAKNEYKNVIGSIGIENKRRIIIGAHYDVCGDSEGADDNASGVVALLQLARLLSREKLKYRIDFVAFTLEEPPFFRTKNMGSYIHAKYLYENKIAIKGMICLETIGYYSGKSKSQKFPIKEMELIYGNIGNFIMVVQNEKSEKFSKQVTSLMKKEALIKTESIKDSSDLPGVDFSDHLNYWRFNFEAVMVTNTAFYRNKNYHTKDDTLETLDLEKMSLVINQLHKTILQIK